MKNKAVIVVYVNTDGLDEMIAHILDGSLDKYKPSLTVNSSLHNFPIPTMDAQGRIPSPQSENDNEGTAEA